MKLYTTEEVADILSVTIRTVYNYIKQGKIKAVKIGKYWRIPEENLKEFLQPLEETKPAPVPYIPRQS